MTLSLFQLAVPPAMGAPSAFEGSMGIVCLLGEVREG